MARDSKSSERKTGVAAWNESAGISSRAQASKNGHHNHAVQEKRRRQAYLIILALLCVACAICAWPLNGSITRGLWLKGGTSYTMVATNAEGGKPSSEELSSAASAIQGRLGSANISEYSVGQSGDDKVSINLSNLVEKGEIIARIVGGAGKVEFARFDEIGDADALIKINAGTEGVELKEGTYTSFLDGSAIKSSDVRDVGTGTYAVQINFTDEGSKTFAEVTKELAEDYGAIAVIVDSHVYAVMSVSQEISEGTCYITGDFTKEEASALKAVFESDTLPLTLTYQGSQEIGVLLGKPMLWGLVALALVAFVVVAVLAFKKFHKLSVLVMGAMAVYAVLMLGLMSLASRLNMFVLTLPGVLGGAWAAATATMGVWLICTRFQDKVAKGGSIKGTAKSAPAEGLRPLAMPCGIVSVIAIVLLFVPMPALHDFGLVVVFGMICGIAAVGWFAITLLRILSAGAMQDNPTAWGLEVSSTEEAAS